MSLAALPIFYLIVEMDAVPIDFGEAGADRGVDVVAGDGVGLLVAAVVVVVVAVVVFAVGPPLRSLR